MRIIAEIPHPECRISIFSMNQKWIIKLEKGPYEQTYKVSELDVATLEEVKNIINEDFIIGCLNRFEEMKNGFIIALKNII
jgi:hypothetical protein